LHLYRYVDLEKIEYLFGEKIVSDFNAGPTIQRFRSVFAEAEEADFQTTMMYVFENLHLPGLLQRLDATTMGASVEGRVPFVDHNLVEFSFQIPNSFKMRWIDEIPPDIIGADSSEKYDITKWALKQACSDILPDEIIERKKVGFPVPLKNWFGSGSINDVRANLLCGRMVASGLVKRKKIEKLLSEEEESGQHSMLIWMLINLEIFLMSYPDLEINLD
jgi:asparagine synthase (glutamine-hydrolysing)